MSLDKALFTKYNIEKNITEIEKILKLFFTNIKIVDHLTFSFIFNTMLQHRNIEIFKKTILYVIDQDIKLNNHVYDNITIWRIITIREFLKYNYNSILIFLDYDKSVKNDVQNFLENL